MTNDSLIPLPKWLPTATSHMKAAWRLLRTIGPALLSDRIVSHSKRMAEVEFIATLLKHEAESVSEIRRSLWKRYGRAKGEDRWRALSDIKHLDSDLRRLGITNRALSHLTEYTKESENTDSFTEISGHWMGVFQQLSSAENEEWRQELLARALAAQAAKPGALSAKALWTIGTLSHFAFDSFAYILDCCTWIRGGAGNERPIIPGPVALMTDYIAKGAGWTRDVKLGTLIYDLQESGLLGEIFANSVDLTGDTYTFRYGDESIQFVWSGKNGRFNIAGLMPSVLGAEVARLYSPQKREFGQMCFERLKAMLASAKEKK